MIRAWAVVRQRRAVAPLPAFVSVVVSALAGAFALGLAACTHASSLPASALPASGSPAYLFSYFRGNGDDGVHLAWSADGITWSALNGGKAVITPAITGDGVGWQEWNTKAALMRDPSTPLVSDR